MEKIDTTKTVESYLHNEDWRVKENASATFNLSGLIRYNSGAIVSRYWLNDIYTEPIAQAHRNCYIHIHDLSLFAPYCFTGDTRIATLDGKNHSFEELVQANVKELWVYAYDRKNNRVVPALAINPRVTREVSELVKVTLNNGKTITSTSDHLYMTRDGEYIDAKNLVKGMSLMPLYVENLGRYVGINPDWYSGKRGYVHRWVMENILGRQLTENEVVHHKNGDKHDNRPSNLEVMDDAEHRAMEINKTMLTQVWKDNNALRLAQYNKSEAKRRSVSDFANTRNRDEKGRFTDFAFDETLNETSEVYNHKVRKVEFIELDEPIKVYDLTVPEFENFALDAGIFVHNCAGWSLRQLLTEGFGGVEGKTNSAPAKHLHTAVNHIVNFLGVLQLEWAGAQAFSSLDTYLAPFIKADNMDYKAVKQCVQSLVFGLNISSRWGEPPFSNFTIDWTCPEDMKYLPAIVGGKEMDFTYGECQKEMDMFNKALMEVMIEGDANGRGHIYPVLTYSITKDFDWSETENNKLLFEMSAKYGIPYFSNYVNSDMDASDVRSMCCRLRLDLRELRRKNGGFFGSGESTGSIGVVTLNLPRMAYTALTYEDFFAQIEKYMDIAKESLEIKRKTCTEWLENGLYPYTKRYLGTFDNHFSTIGLVGMYEAWLNLKNNLHVKYCEVADYSSFAKDVLNFMRYRIQGYQEETGNIYNLESTPAESTSYRFARHDVETLPDIITAGTHEAPFYTNSSNLPVNYTDDVFEMLDIQDGIQTLYTGGTVAHVFLGEKLPNWRTCMLLVRKIAENYKLPYFTISPTYSVCADHGYITGEHWTCPTCGKPTEVYSRITGYFRPVKNWNIGKREEFKERKTYKVV